MVKYTPQNKIDAFCVERILKTNLTIYPKFLDIFDALLPRATAKRKW